MDEARACYRTALYPDVLSVVSSYLPSDDQQRVGDISDETRKAVDMSVERLETTSSKMHALLSSSVGLRTLIRA